MKERKNHVDNVYQLNSEKGEEELTWESLLRLSNYHCEAGDLNAEWPYQKHDQTPILQPCHFSHMYPPTKHQPISKKFIHLPIKWIITKYKK